MHPQTSSTQRNSLTPLNSMCYITFLSPTIIIIIYPQLLHLYHSWDCGGSFQAVRERPYAIAVPRHSLQASLGFTLDIQSPKSYRARKQIHCFLVPVRSSWQTSYFVDCLIAMKCVRKVCDLHSSVHKRSGGRGPGDGGPGYPLYGGGHAIDFFFN